MNILILTPDYPDNRRSVYPFVKQVVDEFAKQGNHCFVVAPFSITKNKSRYQEVEKVNGNITIFRPNYLSFSNFRIGRFCPSLYLRQRAIDRVLQHLPVRPDVMYCHFWECGLEGYEYAKKGGVPLFVASGESSIQSLLLHKKIPSDFGDVVRGVICVSTKNKLESVSLGLTTDDRCLVKPNAINNQLFRKMDKLDARKSLGIPQDAFVVCFVGSLIERKGPKRVSEAICQISGKPVYSIFIGKGGQEPKCNHIIYKGGLSHKEIPIYLNASDVFVLPTLAEGCCNAIVEAMACGLPIISSDLSFNWDVLDNSNSLLVDPMDIGAIRDAIVCLRDNNQLRNDMSANSLKKARELTIDKRTESILDFIKERIHI